MELTIWQIYGIIINNMENKEFGKKLKELIVELGITQREFSQRLGIFDSAMSRYIKGERTPRVDLLWKISKTFNVPLSYFDKGIKKQDYMPSIKNMVARKGKDLSQKVRLELIKILSERIEK